MDDLEDPFGIQRLNTPQLQPMASPTIDSSGYRPPIPIELINLILVYLPVPDLMTFSLLNKTIREMVLEDSRWVIYLRRLGVWDEKAARLVAEEEQRQKIKRAHEQVLGRQVDDVNLLSSTVGNMDLISFEFKDDVGKVDPVHKLPDSELLGVLKSVVSARGKALNSFAKIYVSISPLVNELMSIKSHTSSKVFTNFKEPEDQAELLQILIRFLSVPCVVRDQSKKFKRLRYMIEHFENAALRQFEIGYEQKNYQKMRRYATVLKLLNGGRKAWKLFIDKNSIFYEGPDAGECFSNRSNGVINIEPLTTFFENVISANKKQAEQVEKIFEDPRKVQIEFTNRIFNEVLATYINSLVDLAHLANIEVYLKTVALSFQKCLEVIEGAALDASYSNPMFVVLGEMYQYHLDLYFHEEKEFMSERLKEQVQSWDKKRTDEDAATELSILSNVQHEGAKQDFLTSFRKVLLAPVNFVSVIPFSTSKKKTQNSNGEVVSEVIISTEPGKENADDSMTNDIIKDLALPTDQAGANDLLITVRLEGIHTLISLELALQILQLGKESLARLRLFKVLDSQIGKQAKELCEEVFCIILQILGDEHIKNGFDRATEHLSHYRPLGGAHKPTVAPLVAFLKLVQVADLIQQMVNVFFKEELAASIDRNDFLNPAMKGKKQFEQLMDTKIANGLNKGIDVLIDQVEYIFRSMQTKIDFYPPPSSAVGVQDLNLDPTNAARAAIECLKTHTQLLVGSTDKTVLDVFLQEVCLRFFGSIVKHIKRQTINAEGGLKLISDLNLFHAWVQSLKQRSVMPYFNALKEIGNIFIIEADEAKAIGMVVADQERYQGIFKPEEVYEFATCRADWLKVKKEVEKQMYGIRPEDCRIM